MTKATILDKGFVQGHAEFQVEISDGVDLVKKNYIVDSIDQLKRSVLNDIKRFDACKTFIESVPVGDIEIASVVDVAPSQAQIDEQAWFTLYRRWVQVKKDLIDTGIIPATNAKAVALLNQVKAGLKVEYVDKI